MELGTSSFNSGGRAVCDTTLSFYVPLTPRMLLDFHDDGTYAMYRSGFGYVQEWSDACLTTLGSGFACNSIDGAELISCELDCDLCTCQASKFETSFVAQNWTVTAGSITLNLLGLEAAHDFCVAEDQLRISARGVYFEFERVETYGRPRPCSERGTDVCMTGTGCVLETGGVCTGDASQQCALADFGVVPGCGFVEGPLRCVGDGWACEGRAAVNCTDGCSMMQGFVCRGGARSCSEFQDCPNVFCDADCTGMVTCEDRKTMEECQDLNEVLLASQSCDYITVQSCVGTQTPCSSRTAEECETLPGCYLEPDE